MRWLTVFTLDTSGFEVFLPPIAVIAVAVFIAALAFRSSAKLRGNDDINRRQRHAARGFAMLAVLFCGIAAYLTVGYVEFAHRLHDKAYWTIEGQVHGLSSERKREKFTVNGVPFIYGDYDLTPCFHNAATHGGPMRDGLHVRITYLRDPVLERNCIIHLQVDAAPSMGQS